jgi:hypothetical protein
LTPAGAFRKPEEWNDGIAETSGGGLDEKEILVESSVKIVDPYQLLEIQKELCFVPEPIRQTFPLRISFAHLKLLMIDA